jgi:hypothetical protein
MEVVASYNVSMEEETMCCSAWQRVLLEESNIWMIGIDVDSFILVALD